MDRGKVIQESHLHLDGAVASVMAGKTLQELEKQLITETLQVHQNRTKAAETLGITVKQLRDKLQEYQLN
jgi:two-component system response regulator AtoC